MYWHLLTVIICLTLPNNNAQPQNSGYYEAALARLARGEADGNSDENTVLLANAKQQLANLQREETFRQKLADGIIKIQKDNQALIETIAEKESGHHLDLLESSDIDDLNEQFNSLKEELGKLNQEREKLETDHQRFTERALKIRCDADKAHDELKNIPPVTPQSTELAKLSSEITSAALTARINNLQQLQKDSRSYEELLKNKITLNNLERQQKQQDFEEVRKQVETHRLSQANLLYEQAKQLADSLSDLPPDQQNLKNRGERLLNMALQRTTNDSALNQHLKIRETLKNTQEQLADLQKRKKSITDKVNSIGLTPAIGFLLRQEKLELPTTKDFGQKRKTLRHQMSEVQLQLVKTEEERQQLLNKRSRQQSLLEESLNTHTAKVMDALLEDQSLLFYSLVDLDDTYGQIALLTEEITTYIDERIYWIPSSSSLAAMDIDSFKGAITFFLAPEQWLPVIRNYKTYLPQIFLWPALVLSLLLVYLCFLRKRLKRLWLKATSQLEEQTSKTWSTSRALTSADEGRKWLIAMGEAFGSMLLMALPQPLIMLTMSAACFSLSRDSAFFSAIAYGFISSALVLYLFELIQFFMEAKGLKVLGTHWSSEEWRRGNFHAAWIKHIVSITVFICSSLQNQTSEVLRNSLGRFSFVICLIACSCWLLLMIKAFWRTRHHGWRRFIHHLCLILLIIAPAALMVLTIMGYYLTAIQLAFKLLLQVAIILLLIIISSIILEIIRFQALQAEVAKENWLTFNKLVKAVSLILILGSCLFIWNDVLPALNVINSITLWTIKIETGVQNISLGDAMLAVIIAFITILITRNMPMLLTLVKFDKLPWDTGLRNAVATLVRYSIIIIGFGSALSVLGLSWSDIQWLVAAVSVGLGFGLQEIFANFISGIIILFERPVRPGDTVTIGDVSGEVTKINIRATTIKDWDNREMIVPNKEFITGHILNWTGSDNIQRAVITVGVAYGSDTQLVQDILLKIAADNPYVLKTPQPSVVFDEFADSSLNFNLRTYVDIDNLTTAKHTLRLAINKEFSAAGIEIAFPQLDVHICNNEAAAAKN